MTNETPSPDAPISDAEIAELKHTIETTPYADVLLDKDHAVLLIAELSRLRAAQAGGVAGENRLRDMRDLIARAAHCQLPCACLRNPQSNGLCCAALAKEALALAASPPPPVAQQPEQEVMPSDQSDNSSDTTGRNTPPPQPTVANDTAGVPVAQPMGEEELMVIFQAAFDKEYFIHRPHALERGHRAGIRAVLAALVLTVQSTPEGERK